MKAIEGQTLLSINQYFPIDYLRMAKKSQGMMNLFIENISEKVRKGIMDYDLDSPSLEISNQADPLFSITPEEVELVKQSLLTEKNVIIDIHVKYPAVDAYIIKTRDKINNLLNRIKQWQDEKI